MSRSVGLAHIVREEGGVSAGLWGSFRLATAFQPIFAFNLERQLVMVACEGLLRPERDGASMSPGEFFGLVSAVERMHVETLSRTIHILNAGRFLDPSIDLFVNFNPSLFISSELSHAALRDMRLVLHEAQVDPARIVCELTEQPATSEQALFQFVEALREHGFRIAVDDFGAQNSDMQRINELRPDIVKFDGQWVVRLMATASGKALLQVMVARFRERGILNLFEGIEESWQIDFAESCGVDMVQGFVLARPERVPTTFFPPADPVGPDDGSPAAPTHPPQKKTHPGRPVFGRRSE